MEHVLNQTVSEDSPRCKSRWLGDFCFGVEYIFHRISIFQNNKGQSKGHESDVLLSFCNVKDVACYVFIVDPTPSFV